MRRHLLLLLALSLPAPSYAQPVRPMPRPAPTPSMVQTGVRMPEALPTTPTGTGLTTVGPPDAQQVVRRSEGALLVPGAGPEWRASSVPDASPVEKVALALEFKGVPEEILNYCRASVLSGFRAEKIPLLTQKDLCGFADVLDACLFAFFDDVGRGLPKRDLSKIAAGAWDEKAFRDSSRLTRKRVCEDAGVYVKPDYVHHLIFGRDPDYGRTGLINKWDDFIRARTSR